MPLNSASAALQFKWNFAQRTNPFLSFTVIWSTTSQCSLSSLAHKWVSFSNSRTGCTLASSAAQTLGAHPGSILTPHYIKHRTSPPRRCQMRRSSARLVTRFTSELCCNPVTRAESGYKLSHWIPAHCTCRILQFGLWFLSPLSYVIGIVFNQWDRFRNDMSFN